MRLKKTWLASVVMICAAGRLAAEHRFDEQQLGQITARMSDFVRDGQIAGAVTLVATKDRIVHLGAVGQADVAAGRMMQPDTIFRIASMTKPITSTALMMLVEQGKLAVDDPVSKYIPAFASMKLKEGGTAQPVTVRHILTHTAGLATNQSPGERSLSEFVDQIGGQPLEFAPGSKWQYSSGLTVAGRLIEVVSGELYAGFLQRHVFEPLGMKDTSFQLTPQQAARLAVTYQSASGSKTLVPVEIPDPTVTRTPNPSGGLFSTAADMARFYQAILNRGTLGATRLLPPDRVAEMTRILTPGIVTGFTPGNGWGLGWCVVERPQGVTRLFSPGTFGHGGAWGTQGWIDPQRGLILVLMIQRSGLGNSDASAVREAFTELALQASRGEETATARFVDYHGYSGAVELRQGDVRAILCPQAGGRVLEFSVAGANAMSLDEREGSQKPGRPDAVSAGRFDFGPELTTPPHPVIWSGAWTAEITGPSSARLISQRDQRSGVQLIRDFSIVVPESPPGKGNLGDSFSKLSCKQTIINVSTEPREYCHWGRSFSPGGGICFIPLTGPSRFPGKYAMYEEGGLINVRNTDDRIRERDGFLEIVGPPRKPKLGFDSYAGWLAYAMPGDRLFVKRFRTYPDRVYNEAAGLTISVWYPQAGNVIELEPIGPRERLQPGEAASFTEDWWLLRFPFPRESEQVDLGRLREFVLANTSAP